MNNLEQNITDINKFFLQYKNIINNNDLLEIDTETFNKKLYILNSNLEKIKENFNDLFNDLDN